MVGKIGVVVLLLFLIFNFVSKKNEQKTNLVIKQSMLIIPKLDINAKIQLVGVNETGNMDVPNNSQDVGLFDLGPKPGEIGSSVISGHFDDENGSQAVFYNLNKLVKGDKIFIEDDNNKRTTFIVQKVRRFDEKYAEEVFSSNDMAHLNLITCSGVWNKTTNSYNNRFVVFSDLLI